MKERILEAIYKKIEEDPEKNHLQKHSQLKLVQMVMLFLLHMLIIYQMFIMVQLLQHIAILMLLN